MDHDRVLRGHLLEVLRGGHAHQTFSDIVANLPEKLRATHPGADLPTPWQLLEHLRISQWDILEFTRDPRHVSPDWPKGYWPEGDAPPDARAWERSVEAFEKDLTDMIALVEDPGEDLFKPFAHGEGQTLAREAILDSVHNAYHLGQMVTARKLLGTWPPK